MELYNGYINEFVDWVTGADTSLNESTNVTRASSTGGLPASGGSIRELVLSKLRKPFISYEDEKAGLYRLFSSEDTKNKWIRMNTEGSADYDPEGSSKLELFNFVRPSDTVLTYNGLDPNPRYIINGDSTSNAAQLQYNVYLSKEVAGASVYESDSFTVTYKVVDSNNVEHISVEEKDSTFLNSSKKVTKNIYSMLSVGQNTVTVTMKARNSSALNSITFPVYLISFELASSFDYSSHFDPTKPIDVPISVKRSDTSLTLRVDIYVDGTLAKLSSDNMSPATWIVNNNETNPTRRISISNTYAPNVTSQDHIKHGMKIEALMYDQDSGVVYFSNVLFFDFVVASSTIGIVNKFITTGYSVPYNKVSTDTNTGRVILKATQYEPFSLNWAYYTDRETTQQSINLEWALRIGYEEYEYRTIRSVEAHNRQEGETLRFIPDIYTTEDNVYLVAMTGGEEIDIFPINIQESSMSISETGGYNIKLSAYGKTNQSVDKNSWDDIDNGVTSTLTGVAFDSNSGWDDNSFITSGIGSYVTINYCPIPNSYDLAGKGKTIEIDFKPEKVVNEDDTLIRIGDPTGGHIDIRTNEAVLFNGVNRIIHTNYKANERIKIAFVFNPVESGNPDSNLVYIINNGILERAKSYGAAASYKSDVGNIKIGDSASGIRVYSIRGYDKALTYDEALSNYIYDCDNKAEVINRNDIFTSSVIDYTKVKNKIDTILIAGNLDRLLTQSFGKDESETTVDIKRECITDSSKNFEVKNGMIRKHGQSTLNYPIASMKIWTNKAKEDNVVTVMNNSSAQQAEGLSKNRYIMKNGAIPSNKFVLQANYADSSGTHNGALLRLIQDTWYNANIDGKYILRTAPQLFASGQVLVHDDQELHEDGSWVEGYGVGAATGKTWPEVANRPFPYKIRVAPDSFPCAVFYQNGANDGYHFLGQYVFMDDKKSDYIYGERSIYYFGNGDDPFVLKTVNTKNGPLGKQDIAANRVWDNSNVLRIEVVLPNEILTSYMNFNFVDKQGVTRAATDIKYKQNGDPDQYYWEDYFEMIYPDDDDVAEDDAKDGLTKFDPNSKFVLKVTPFINFLKWITDCKLNYNNATDWWSAGTYNSTQAAFEATAHDHLDMYKLAAYYIFFLRFGLVDSVERNAQLKTYDGLHWHYEPWDMDIALGNTNQGQLVLDPPMNRNSFEPGTSTYAFSGRGASTSNVLWDCLEAWSYWSDTVVPNVAQALYEAGLDYDSIMAMFDDQYANAWSETMYNESGHYKYIENGGSDWLAWLQGSRTSHRHWWVSTSMNYYDAKWSCGSFNQHRVRIFADKGINPTGTDIVSITPTSSTFFKIAQQEGRTSLGTIEADRTHPALFDVSTASFSAKDPSYIYGGTFIEDIDLSCFAEKLKAADFSLCYDNVLGAPIKRLNVGLPYTVDSSTQYTGKVSGTQLRLTAYDAITNTDAFESLQVLDITGQGTITTTQELLGTRNRRNVTDVYAIGTGITEFISATSGNRFNTIKLPAVTTTTYNNADPTQTVFNTMVMLNSSWNTIEFWNTNKHGDVVYVTDEHGDIVLDDEDNPIIAANAATFTKTTIPHQLSTVQFIGSTASNACAGQFLLDWIDSIEANLASQNPSYTEQDLYDALSVKIFEAENINWGTSLHISYNDLARIAHFNRGNNSGGLIKGYIMLDEAEPLTNAQVNNIIQWFGPSVFNKSSRNSNLVVDQQSEYTSLTTSGTTIVGNDICLKEGHVASIMATKFMLSESDQTVYEWSVAAGENVQSYGVDQVKSVSIHTGDDGITYITASENGTYGDYYVTITAANAGVPTTLTIKIIGSILPDHIIVNTTQVASANARQMKIGSQLGAVSPLFSLAVYDENSLTNEIRDTYVLFLNGQEVEFYAQTVDGSTPSDVQPSVIRYYVSNIMPLFTNSENLTGYENTPANRIGDTNLYYTKSATHNGIVLGVALAPSSPLLYEVKASMTVGAKMFTKTINVVVYDDSQVMHTLLTSAGVHTVLNTLYNSLYRTTLNLYYKSDLYSLVGTLDFSAESTAIGTINAANGNPLLTYMPNISQIDLHGCSNLQAASLGIITNGVLAFTSSDALRVLNLANSSIGNVTLDMTGCPNLTTLNTQDTNAGVKLGAGNVVSSLSLGSPIEVSITRPKLLSTSNITIQSSTNLNSIELVEVNVGDPINNVLPIVNGYGVFNLLYS